MANLPTRNNNPGDLKDTTTGMFRKFSTPQEGFSALESDIQNKIKGNTRTQLTPNSTLRDFAYTWAPPTDNNDSDAYANNLAKKLGVTVDTPIGSLNNRIHDFASAIADNEGYQGTRVAGESEQAAPLSLEQNNTNIKSFIPQANGQLSHSQLVANINAMEQQGAKPDEIQGYLDSLKGVSSSSQGFNPKPFSSPGGIDFSGTQTTPTEQPAQQGGIVNDFANAENKALKVGEQGFSDIAKGNVLSGVGHLASGAIQGVGGVAGAVNNVIGKGIELIPGVKQVEDLIGKGVGSLAQTSAGQSVAKAIGDFAKNNPELADDIGAGFNILTAIPIFKGLGMVKNLAADGLGSVLRNVAVKSAVDGTETAMAATKTLSRAFARNGGRDVVENAVSALGKDALPAVEGGKYATEEAFNNVTNAISEIDKKELQPILEKASQNQRVGQSLETLKQRAIQEAENDVDLRESGSVPQAIKQIEKRFDGWKYSYGDNVDVATENRLKIGSGKFSDWDTPEGTADKAIYRALQGDIEQIAKIQGLGNVGEINARMGNLIQYKNILKALDKTPARISRLRGLLQHAAGIGTGAMIGNAVGGGLPGEIVGGYVGNQAAGILGRKSIGGVLSKLLR